MGLKSRAVITGPACGALLIALGSVALAVGSAACASSSGGVPVPKPFPGAQTAPLEPPSVAAPVPPAIPEPPSPEMARFDPEAVVQTALGFRGVPYRNGGSDPSGFDCSGFVQYVFAQHGLALPREVREQFAFGDEIEIADAREGDLIYFSTVAKGPSHVGMVIGGDEFVHAPSSRGVVRVERFSASYWKTRMVAVKRLR